MKYHRHLYGRYEHESPRHKVLPTPNQHQSLANIRPINMEMSLLSWLALLAFYMLYILLGGCMFNRIEHQMDSRGAIP